MLTHPIHIPSSSLPLSGPDKPYFMFHSVVITYWYHTISGINAIVCASAAREKHQPLNLAARSGPVVATGWHLQLHFFFLPDHARVFSRSLRQKFQLCRNPNENITSNISLWFPYQLVTSRRLAHPPARFSLPLYLITFVVIMALTMDDGISLLQPTAAAPPPPHKSSHITNPVDAIDKLENAAKLLLLRVCIYRANLFKFHGSTAAVRFKCMPRKNRHAARQDDVHKTTTYRARNKQSTPPSQ